MRKITRDDTLKPKAFVSDALTRFHYSMKESDTDDESSYFVSVVTPGSGVQTVANFNDEVDISIVIMSLYASLWENMKQNGATAWDLPGFMAMLEDSTMFALKGFASHMMGEPQTTEFAENRRNRKH